MFKNLGFASVFKIHEDPRARSLTYTNDPLAGLLVVFNDLVISQRSKHVMHTIF